MPKLPTTYSFFDVSDYGRPPALYIAQHLKYTPITPIHVSIGFAIVWVIAIVCIIWWWYGVAGILLIIKSILDAADGELSRIKNTPSYSGRYLDSILDIILNLCILIAIGYIAYQSIRWVIIAFFCIQLQWTLYNYYYVILRHAHHGGDNTSRIMENTPPKAFPYEKQSTVDILFYLFRFLYGVFDRIIIKLDPQAMHSKNFPGWFMTCVSLYGLGWQLLIISILLWSHHITWILPFFVIYTALIPLLIGIRKYLL